MSYTSQTECHLLCYAGAGSESKHLPGPHSWQVTKMELETGLGLLVLFTPLTVFTTCRPRRSGGGGMLKLGCREGVAEGGLSVSPHPGGHRCSFSLKGKRVVQGWQKCWE